MAVGGQVFPMAGRPLAVPVLLALCTMTISPTAVGGASTGDAPDVVEIDAASGELLTPPAAPGTSVTVRVHGVPASASGFDLEGPPGPLFVNQSSRHDGVLAFWDVPAGPGTYHVNRSTPDGNTTLASVEIAHVPPAGEVCDDADGDCSRTTWWCSYTRSEKLGEETHWTPLVAVNSPSGGDAVASTKWSDTEALYVSPGDWRSSTQHSEQINAYDGESKGFYRVAKWGIYERTTGGCWGSETTIREAKVIDWRPKGYIEETTIDITGDSRYTDRDNPTRVEAHDETSLTHDMRYKTTDRIRHGPNERGINDEEITAIAGSVSAGTQHVDFEVISFELAQEETVSYTYRFPHGTWHITELSGGPGWAFCNPDEADCR